jgi:AmmeMemoRadiSam system protein B/AmmeMemoRadiSam system protein A
MTPLRYFQEGDISMKVMALLSFCIALLLLFSCEDEEGFAERGRGDQQQRESPQKPEEPEKPDKKGPPATAKGPAEPVRESLSAGRWYPADPKALRKTVEKYLSAVPDRQFAEEPIGFIVPHAGYVYCWQVAAYSYKYMKELDFETAVLVGSSHRYRLGGAAILTNGSLTTPLGPLEIDSQIAKSILKGSAKIRENEIPHRGEHSLENQLPFLRHLFGRRVRIVPILVNAWSYKDLEAIGRAIGRAMKDRRALLVCSTDLSHYPSYEEACKVDRELIDSMKGLDPKAVIKKDRELLGRSIKELHCTACGLDAVIATMVAAKELGATRFEQLHYANSGDVPIGDKRQVVGYLAAAFLRKKGLSGKKPGAGSDAESAAPGRKTREEKPMSEPKGPEGKPQEQKSSREKPEGKGGTATELTFGTEARKLLLAIARKSAEAAVRRKSLPAVTSDLTELQIRAGCFVTIRNKGRLRGCIGCFESGEPLYRTVALKARDSATRDTRFVFDPITPRELPELSYEISVLSPLKPVAGPDDFQLGKHGLLIERGFSGAVFLPQVATETGWSKEEFLKHLCQKAGLPPDDWKKPGMKFSIFTVAIIEEEKE